MKISYQFVLFNTPTETVERTLLWIQKAAENYKSENPSFSLEVRVGDCSQTKKTSERTWAKWKKVFKKEFDLDYDFFNENLGHGGAQNRLALKSSGEYLIFANPDILVSPNIFGILIQSFQRTKNLAAIDAKQLPFEHPKDYDLTTGDTSWCSGAFFMVSKKAFDLVGGFDHQTFYMHCDDVDLSWRLKLAGYKIAHQPAAVVNHTKLLTSTGTISTTDTERKYAAQSALLLPYKWSRNGIVRKVKKQFRKSNDKYHQMALKHFDLLKAKNELPKKLDPLHRVSMFKKGNYAKHRWS